MRVPLVIALALALAACTPDATNEVWSSKDNPVLGSDGVSLRPTVVAASASADYPAAVRDAAISILLQASESPSPLLRANAIEALHPERDEVLPIVQRSLADENRGVRFVAAMTVGTLELSEISHLVEPLTRDDSPSVRAAALFAMRRCGHRVDLGPLAEMIVSHDPEVKANAAMILGELGNRSSLPMLRAAVGRGTVLTGNLRARIVDLQLAEAMVRLGDLGQIEVIRAALFAPAEEGELKALACMISGRVRDERAIPTLDDLAQREGDRREPAEVRMAATYGLALINPERAPAHVPAGFLHSRYPALRAQAALTLGEIGDPSMTNAVAALLDDEEPIVQVAAAGALLRMQGTASVVGR